MDLQLASELHRRDRFLEECFGPCVGEVEELLLKTMTSKNASQEAMVSRTKVVGGMIKCRSALPATSPKEARLFGATKKYCQKQTARRLDLTAVNKL